MVRDGMHLRVSAPPEHGGLLLRQQRQNLFGILRLLFRPYQLNRRLMEPLPGGLTVGAQPAAHQQLKNRVPHVSKSNGADAPQLVLRHLNFKMVLHTSSLQGKRFAFRKSFKNFQLLYYHKNRKNSSLVPLSAPGV